MDNQTLFYVCGIAAAVSAVVVSIIGLKVKSFPGKAFPIVVLWFAILIGAAATFSVLHAKDEEQEKAAEFEKAGKEFEAEDNDDAAGEAPQGSEGEAKAPATAKGPGGTLQIAADPTDIAYDKTSLASKPGKVTIDLNNPSAISHDIAIENDAGEEIAGSELVAEGETELTAELAPGTYTFYCTVPGHREAGMEGPLKVQ
jgi:plastocyanin